jgi:urease accessory protein UreH
MEPSKEVVRLKNRLCRAMPAGVIMVTVNGEGRCLPPLAFTNLLPDREWEIMTWELMVSVLQSQYVFPPGVLFLEILLGDPNVPRLTEAKSLDGYHIFVTVYVTKARTTVQFVNKYTSTHQIITGSTSGSADDPASKLSLLCHQAVCVKRAELVDPSTCFRFLADAVELVRSCHTTYPV